MTPEDLQAVRNAALEERFWTKVRKTDGCWEWTACRLNRGHGHFSQEKLERWVEADAKRRANEDKSKPATNSPSLRKQFSTKERK